jgi:hypothetical protein
MVLIHLKNRHHNLSGIRYSFDSIEQAILRFAQWNVKLDPIKKTADNAPITILTLLP